MTLRPTRLVLLGHPIGQSFSPAFQNAALRTLSIPLRYEPLDVPAETLSSTVRALVGERAAGNVTVPHKPAVAALCERRSVEAERTSAVNTFWVEEGGELAGDNTDVGGFDALVRVVVGVTPTQARVALLGAGGAAAAVLAASERWGGARVRLWSRSSSRAEQLRAKWPHVEQIAPTPVEAVRDATVVVNATPIGMRDDRHPVSADALPRGAAVVDLVYRAGETSWVRAARAAGHAAGDGLEMLLEQGALAFERWFAVGAPRDVMRDALWKVAGRGG